MSHVVTMSRDRRVALLILLPLALFIILATLLQPDEPTGHAPRRQARDVAPTTTELRTDLRPVLDSLIEKLHAASAPVPEVVVPQVVEAPKPRPHVDHKPCKCIRPEPELLDL